MNGNFAGITRQPSQTLPEDKWTKEEYQKNLLFIAANWNRIVYTFSPTGVPNTAVPKWWVVEYLSNMSYYYGQNQSIDYKFLTTDERGNPLPFPKYKGRDIRELIDFVVGNMLQFIKAIPKIISSVGVSEEMVSKKQQLLDFAKWKLENRETEQLMGLFTGLKFEPIDGINFESQREVDTYFQSFKDKLEEIYVTLAKYAFYYNYGVEKFKKAAEFYCVGGIATIRVYAHNGQTKWEVVEPQTAVWDNAKSDDQHREDRFAGLVMYKTIPEVLSMFKWTKEEREEMEVIAQNKIMMGQYNLYMANNIIWWDAQPTGIPRLCVVHGEWRSKKYVGLDDEGNEIWDDCLRQGWLIGNKWVKGEGISTNQISSKTQDKKLQLSYITVTPDTNLGIVEGMVDKLKRYQDTKDLIKTKLLQLVSRSKGKNYVLYSDRLPEGLRAPDILSQFSQAGLVVAPSVDMDDEGGAKNLLDTVDMTLDPTVLGLGNLILQERQYMDNIVSLPANARGMNMGYQSKDALAMNINNSNMGMASFYDNFYIFMKRVLEYSADMSKLIMPEQNNDMLTVLIGDVGVQMLQEDLKKMQFEDFALALSTDDVATEQDKQIFINYFMQKAAATNNPEDDLVVINLSKMTSKTEIINYLEQVTSKKLQRMAEEREQANAQQQQMASTAAEANVESTAISAEAQLAKQQSQQDHEIDKMLLEKEINP
jgi:hypothetical protein